MKPLQIALIQFSPSWENPEKNLVVLDKLLATLGNVDLILLPEMFSSGFSMQPQLIAKMNQDLVLPWMQQQAYRHDAVIAGSLAIKAANGFVNRFFWQVPEGASQVYDKRHCFSLAGEDKAYLSGNSRVIVNWRGMRFLLQVCYDLRFPVFSRNCDDYDCLVNVASWPAPRTTVWSTLLQARAIENQAYAIGVNRIGKDGNGIDYLGHSGVYFCDGTAELSPNDSSGVLYAQLNKTKLDTFRDRYPFYRDADNFQLLNINHRRDK